MKQNQRLNKDFRSVLLNLPTNVFNKFDLICYNTGKTKSEVLRGLLQGYLNKQ